MDEFTADAFVNRDEPVPLITVSNNDQDAPSSEADTSSHKGRFRGALSASSSRLKAKGQELLAAQLEKHESSPEPKLSLQDRLFSKYGKVVYALNPPYLATNILTAIDV